MRNSLQRHLNNYCQLKKLLTQRKNRFNRGKPEKNRKLIFVMVMKASIQYKLLLKPRSRSRSERMLREQLQTI